ncbi:uncharacterized protein LY79DRAFT_689237 [Colletotrichum navitas]|uniref:Uncharacterized protein n=1 Tax=Colletotrichum navitas TaxID=681940 RepID=A0AAD8QBL3_9PEZI|nr:uncharacterized protein LY79DRAFT_689237 [Colletotrichum navitas]KAK1598677.1 hypothetical protein LY79DRAFT_689237 [Colletotrichum navitas]
MPALSPDGRSGDTLPAFNSEVNSPEVQSSSSHNSEADCAINELSGECVSHEDDDQEPSPKKSLIKTRVPATSNTKETGKNGKKRGRDDNAIPKKPVKKARTSPGPRDGSTESSKKSSAKRTAASTRPKHQNGNVVGSRSNLDRLLVEQGRGVQKRLTLEVGVSRVQTLTGGFPTAAEDLPDRPDEAGGEHDFACED